MIAIIKFLSSADYWELIEKIDSCQRCIVKGLGEQMKNAVWQVLTGCLEVFFFFFLVEYVVLSNTWSLTGCLPEQPDQKDGFNFEGGPS